MKHLEMECMDVFFPAETQGRVRFFFPKKERKKTDTPREGWEDGTPPPHRDFKERGVVR